MYLKGKLLSLFVGILFIIPCLSWGEQEAEQTFYSKQLL